MNNVGGVAAGRAAADATFRFEDLPLLGEPLIVEFANSLYRRADNSIIDYLNSAQSVTEWFSYPPAVQGTVPPSPVLAPTLFDLQQLRGAVIVLLDATVGDGVVDDHAVSALNAFAARAPGQLELSWLSTGPSAALKHIGRQTDIFLASLASDFISFMAGPDLESVRRCERPGCFMFFLQQHKSRRFCHDGCSHQMRQSRYYRSSHVNQSREKLVRS